MADKEFQIFILIRNKIVEFGEKMVDMMILNSKCFKIVFMEICKKDILRNTSEIIINNVGHL